jgi:hypothetical protein
MAAGYRQWTVLPHGPIEVLAPNLWWVEGVLNPQDRGSRRVMVLARLRDGRILMHNAIALDDPSMAKIDAWGDVAAILVPNRFHRQDAYIMQRRYPRAKVYAPAGAVKGVSKVTPVSGTYGDVPTDDTISLEDIRGVRVREGVMVVRSDDGASSVFCDTVMNLPKLSGVMGWLRYPTGTLSVPRSASLLAKDRRALQSDLLRVASRKDLVRVIPGHGAVVRYRAKEALRTAAERL